MGKSTKKWKNQSWLDRLTDTVLAWAEKGVDSFQGYLKSVASIVWVRTALIFMVSAVVSFFIYHDFFSPFLNYRLGETAQRAVIAPKTIEIFDEEATEARRRSAKDGVLEVYDLDQRRLFASVDRLGQVFESTRNRYGSLVTHADPLQHPEFAEAKESFSNRLSVEVSEEQFLALIRLNLSYRLEKSLIDLLLNANSRLITSNKELLDQQRTRGITLIRHREDSSPEEQYFQDFDRVISWEQAKVQLSQKGQQVFSWVVPKTRQHVISFAKSLVHPNLTFNQKESELRREAAYLAASPVGFRVNRGELVVQIHDVIDQKQLRILSAIRNEVGTKNTFYKYLFSTVFIFLILFSLAKTVGSGFSSLKPTIRDIMVCAVLLVGFIVPTKFLQYISLTAFRNNDQFAHIPLEFFYYIMPVATAPMLIRMLIGKELAAFYTIVVALISGFLLDRSFFFVCFVMTSSLMGIAAVSRIQTRSALYTAGLKVGIFNALFLTSIFALSYGLNFSDLGSRDLQWWLIAGICSGVFSSILVSVLAPMFEGVFGYVTDIKLLELSNLEHPLLKEMVVRAPGTYHHSLMIGNLVESAAESIGANPLLARVMAMYHDIGKMLKPHYFIENQGEMLNPHDRLTPSMSAMVIKEHVWGGVELGRKHRIPRVILAGIPEHHGTALITYFHNRHVQNQIDQGEEPSSKANEAIFRHEGPKPQTKETALLMLADAIEAATRSIKDPTVQKIQGMIQRIFAKVIDDGQLSEVDLTLQDLKKIEESFVHHVVNIHHHRIEYNNSPKKPSEYSNANKPKSVSNRSEIAQTHDSDTGPKKGSDEVAQKATAGGGRSHLKPLPSISPSAEDAASRRSGGKEG